MYSVHIQADNLSKLFTLFAGLELVAGVGGWSGVREKYCWLEAGARTVWKENTVGLEAAESAEQSDYEESKITENKEHRLRTISIRDFSEFAQSMKEW